MDLREQGSVKLKLTAIYDLCWHNLTGRYQPLDFAMRRFESADDLSLANQCVHANANYQLQGLHHQAFCRGAGAVPPPAIPEPERPHVTQPTIEPCLTVLCGRFLEFFYQNGHRMRNFVLSIC